MCRLLYINSKSEFDISEYLKKFAEISKNSKEFQGHGWGFAYIENGEWKYYKNINPIWEDDISKFGKTKRLIAHARSAFKDKDIVVENNMPFYDDNYVFVFNGELSGVKIKEEGRIGAEKIFNFIKRFDNNDIETALIKGVSVIKKRSSYIRAMNIIIADKEKAFVASNFSEDPDYFTMYCKKSDDQIIVCSENFPGEIESDGWTKIKNNSIGVY
ncbi:MAG: class II glutamine amidotransferase [Bacteroidetes bacterium]|nr:class II glutamine amidotransferase [Bacteroidota bacterium]